MNALVILDSVSIFIEVFDGIAWVNNNIGMNFVHVIAMKIISDFGRERLYSNSNFM